MSDETAPAEPKHLNITDPKTGLSICTSDQNGVAGLWITDREGRFVSVQAEKNIGPYLEIRGKRADGKDLHLPFAISADGLQLPQCDADDPYRFVTWDELWDAVQARKAEKAQPALEFSTASLALSVGMSVVYHCPVAKTDVPSLVAHVHEPIAGEEQPRLNLVVFDTGGSKRKLNVPYIAHADETVLGSAVGSWHHVGEEFDLPAPE
jgi:hypothetical protein